ncbi:MAG: histidinol-phosphate transaminase [Kiritimatiellae bacterium]|nr:histidinol-phosphate transaminase [Kiritimatiellia bacterium]
MRIARHVRRLEAYTPGEQPKSRRVVKLNTNENPYPPSPACAEVLRSFDPDRLRRYPDPVFAELRAELAALCGTAPERVFVGNGSDEVLAVAARAFVEDDESIGSLDPSYSLYKTLAAIRGVKWAGVPPPAGEADAPSLLPALARRRVSLFLWTNPNAPTGAFAEPAAIAAFAKRFPGVVIVDEAYADFARSNCMPLAAAAGNSNTLVMRTFSKSYSLAGLRVGWCVGPEDLVAAMYKVKDSYNVDAVAQAVALAAVRDQGWMRANVAKVVKTRARFVRELESRGWDVVPSESNFVFARPPAPATAAALFEALRARNIFVRYFPGPKTGDRLRITIGTDRQMKTLLAALG